MMFITGLCIIAACMVVAGVLESRTPLEVAWIRDVTIIICLIGVVLMASSVLIFAWRHLP